VPYKDDNEFSASEIRIDKRPVVTDAELVMRTLVSFEVAERILGKLQ
jgi:hypothetical protein